MKDKTKLLHERALMTCVIMLFLCIILKLFGVRWFDLDTSIPILNKIDDVVMNNYYASFAYSFIFRFINSYLMYIIIVKETKITKGLLITVIASMLVRPFISNSVLLVLIDVNIFLPICYKKSTLLEYYSVVCLNLLYQVISLFIRNLGVQVSNYGLVISVLLSLDYYIMLIITYLYVKKGDKTICGIVRACFSSLANRLWKRHTEDSQQSSESKER